MTVHVSLQPIDHAPWCDRQHPQTEDGKSFLVSERRYTTPQQPHTDPDLNAALLRAFRDAATEHGTPLYRDVTCEGAALMRLCAASRLRELERQVSELIAEAGRLTRVE